MRPGTEGHDATLLLSGLHHSGPKEVWNDAKKNEEELKGSARESREIEYI